MQFFAYSWKLPAYNGALLLTVDKFSFLYLQLELLSCFLLTKFSFFTYSWSFFAYNAKVLLVRALRDCKQRSLTVSKKAPTVLLVRALRDCKQRSLTVSKRAPTVSKKLPQ